MTARLNSLRRGLLAVVVMLMLTASSQSAVCELTCGLHVEAVSCHFAIGTAAPMEMPEGHCSHGMRMMQRVGHEALLIGDVGCSHASIPLFAKGVSATPAHLTAVQWVVVEDVPTELKALSTGVGGLSRPPLLLGAVSPLSMSLRV